MSLTNYAEGKILDLLLRGVVFTPPTGLKVALYTSSPSDSAAGTQVSGGSYAPQEVSFDSGWANSALILFPNMPTCTVVAVGLLDGSNNLLWYGNDDGAMSVAYAAGDNARLAVGALTVELD